MRAKTIIATYFRAVEQLMLKQMQGSELAAFAPPKCRMLISDRAMQNVAHIPYPFPLTAVPDIEGVVVQAKLLIVDSRTQRTLTFFARTAPVKHAIAIAFVQRHQVISVFCLEALRGRVGQAG